MEFRARLGEWIESPRTQNFIIGIILLNAVILGLETSGAVMARFGSLIHVLDTLCLMIFIVEIAAKLVARGLNFFKNGWSLFDFVIVGIALVARGADLFGAPGAAYFACAAGYLGGPKPAPCG